MEEKMEGRGYLLFLISLSDIIKEIPKEQKNNFGVLLRDNFLENHLRSLGIFPPRDSFQDFLRLIKK